MSNEIKVSSLQLHAPLYCAPFSPDCNKKDIMMRVSRNVAHLAEFLRRAGEEGADITSTPEDVGGINVYLMAGDDGEVFRSLVSDNYNLVLHEFSRIARKYRMYIVTSVYEEVDGKVYNCGMLIDRNGNIAGKYHKTHLPATEKLVVEAGNKYPVFQTEFGNVGILICYDLMFPEPFRIMCLNGADIICNPTYGFVFGGEDVGQIRVQGRCVDNCVVLVVSNWSSLEANCPGCSQIIGFDGRVLAKAGYEPDVIVTTVLDMDKEPIEQVDAEVSGIPNLRARYLVERRPETYGVLVDSNPPLRERHRDARLADPGTAQQVFARWAKTGEWKTSL